MSEGKWIANTRGRDRTCDLEFRKPTLYPTELRGRAVQRYRPRRAGSTRAQLSITICNPNDPKTDGVSNLRASLARVLRVGVNQLLRSRSCLFRDIAIAFDTPDQL